MNVFKIGTRCLQIMAREWFRFELEWEEIKNSKICEGSGAEESGDWEPLADHIETESNVEFFFY